VAQKPNQKGKLVYFRPVDSGKYENRHKKNGNTSYKVKVYDKMYFTEKDILEYQFKGEVFPIGNNANFTIIHNYIIHVWSYFLGKDATYTYIQLRSYDFGCKEVTTVSKKRLMEILGVKKPETVTSYMKLLEEYGFAYMFQCEKENEEQLGSVFVVRSTVPVLPKELYEQLPPSIKKEADRIVSKMSKNTIIEASDDEDEDNSNPLAQKEQEEIKPKEKSKEINIQKVIESVLSQLKALHTETSYNTWFHSYLPKARLENGKIIIPVANEFTKGLYETRYLDQLKELFKMHIGYKEIQIVAE
jgi:hypothetical protein